MSALCLLGLDIGTTNCKAVVYTADGVSVAQARAATPTHTPQPGWAEYEPDELWAVIAGIVREALAGGTWPIAGLSVASMAEAGVLLDADGQPCSPMISWYDTRTLAEQRWWLEEYGGRRVFDITGLTPQPILSLCKLMWLKRHRPDSLTRARVWLNIADWVVYRLTGAQATPPSLAARTMAYDLARRTWSTELLDAAGIPRHIMPPIVPSGQVVGHVTAEAAAQTGLPEGTPVVTAGHDHLVGAFGVGVTEPGHLLNSMGTAEALVMPLLAPALNDLTFQSRANIGAHTARDRYYANVGLHAHGATLDWLRALLVPDLPLADGFAQVNALGSSAPPGSRGAVFQPHLRGISRPIYDPLSRGAFVGLSFQTGRAEMARAVVEGMAFAWRLALESLEQATGLRVEDITVIGGGARNPLWLRVKADITQRTLHVLEVEEAVAWGAAALAGVGVGIFRDAADVRARVRFDETGVAPDPALAALYDDVYTHHYRPVYDALKSVHHRISQPSPGPTV